MFAASRKKGESSQKSSQKKKQKSHNATRLPEQAAAYAQQFIKEENGSQRTRGLSNIQGRGAQPSHTKDTTKPIIYCTYSQSVFS